MGRLADEGSGETMRMPFPGMDPYLEHAALSTSVHARLMVWLAHQLSPLLRPRYVATVEERVFVEQPAKARVPDVWIQKVRETGPATAVAEPLADTPYVVEVEELEIRETFIQILDRYRDLQVVTVIEVVSPSNKSSGPGRDAYLAKQKELMGAECHLVELDLLRTGNHVIAVPESYVESLRPFSGMVNVHRWQQARRFELYPCHLRERLPRIRIPLAEPDPDVPLDIQSALEQVYEDGSYMLRVRYDAPCDPRLTPPDQAWANDRWTAYRQSRVDLFPDT